MDTVYYIDCREVGYRDCSFCAEAPTLEQLIELCAEHGRKEHGLLGFGPELFAKMRPHIRRRETGRAVRN